MRRLVRLQGQLIVRIRDLRSCPIRAEKHADGHVLIPERHGFTKYAKLQALDGAKVCRRSESVRARADDHYIKDRHLWYFMAITLPGRSDAAAYGRPAQFA